MTKYNVDEATADKALTRICLDLFNQRLNYPRTK
jgi:hypothetical protein